MPEAERRLAAVMFTDMVGYQDAFRQDESLAKHLLDKQKSIMREALSTHRGRDIGGNLAAGEETGLKSWIKGPSIKTRETKLQSSESLVLFESAIDATQCAVEILRALREYNREAPSNKDIYVRIAVHVGDVSMRGGEVVGEAVAVASRVAQLAEPEEILISEQVYDQVRNRADLRFVSLGPRELKNVQRPVEVYKVELPWEKKEPMNEGSEGSRVAVLPFANISPDPKDEYFADGMTEELISTISNISELSVISRTSVMSYKGTSKKVKEIGRELEVGSVLEGSVRKAGNKMRITVQLINVRNDMHLWAQSYDRELDDVFAVQSDIAKQVADALRVRILPAETKEIEKKPTSNSNAYVLYLKGRYFWNERTEVGVRKGIEYLHKALREDPNFALAHSDLADCYVIMADYGMLPGAEAGAKVVEYATKALELDGTISQAHASPASAHQRNFRWVDAEREFKRAIELNPNNATAHHWYALNLFFVGKQELSLQEYRKAKELDPLSLIIGAAFGFCLVWNRRQKEGIDMLKKTVQMNESFLPAHRNLAQAYLTTGMYTEAVEEAQKLEKLNPGPMFEANVASVYAKAGHKEEALAILNRVLEEGKSRYVDPTNIAMIYAALGDQTQAFEWLGKAFAAKAAGLPYLQAWAPFDSVRNSPRFRQIIKQIGL